MSSTWVNQYFVKFKGRCRGGVHQSYRKKLSYGTPWGVPPPLPWCIMSISALNSRPDGADFNFSTILKCIHSLSKFVHFSPQRCEQFEKVMDFIQPKMCEKNIKCLKIDVSP
jgi:hypothetical protein